MSRSSALFIAGASLAACATLSRATLAEVALTTRMSDRKVEVGSRFTFQLRATADAGERVDDPQLKLPPGITASGPSVGSQSSISIVNGRMTQSIGINATWVLLATKPGTYKLGPASVQTPTGRKSDRVITIEVVAAGGLPTPPLAGQPLDPFGMLPGLGGPGFPGFPGFPGLDEPAPEPRLPELPEEYRIQHPLDPIAFVRNRAQPRKVVVGEQLTLSAYAYAGRGPFEPGMMGEPSRNDFLAFNLMEPEQQISGYQFDLDGQRWIAAKVSEFALFPLKAGKLKAGAMSFSFVGRAYGPPPQGLSRQAPAIEIVVTEPPLDGRPPGYKVGDVGHYTLSAQVEPREVPASGSVSIVAKLEGTGNVPYTLLVPERDGVHFLEPQIVDQVGPKRGIVQGFRTFTYVVELSQPGEQDLGELSLPYWDPKAQSYGVARATLGKVKVTGTAKPSAVTSLDSGAAHLRGLVEVPPTLGDTSSHRRAYWPSRLGYWALLLGVPLSAVLGFALSDLARTLRARAAARKGSLAAALGDSLAQLDRAAASGDAAATVGAAERALFLAIEKGTGIKARGVLKADLARSLAEAQVPADLAERAASLLGRCDELRFAGEAVDLASFGVDVREASQKLGALKASQRAAGAA